MPDNLQRVILKELREFRKDTNARLASLEETRAEGRGALKTILSSGVIAAAVSWFAGTFHR